MLILPQEFAVSESRDREAGKSLRDVAHSLPPYLTPPVPTTYTLELTAACNHKCVGCGNVFSRQLGFMPGAAWIQLLDDLRTDIVSLRITGGECTLHPDFEDIVHAVDRMAVPFVVFTNGDWRDPDAITKLFAACQHLDGLLISLHGKDAPSHHAFVTTDSFDIVTRNIRRAAEAGIRVGTNTILLRSNLEHIDAIAQLSFSLGAATAAFSRYYGKPIPALALTEAELRQAMVQIADLRRENPNVIFNNCVPTCFSSVDLPTKACTSGFTHCAIDPLGNVRPCTHAPVILGSLRGQSIAEIWDSDAVWAWRNLTTETCAGCSAFSRCRGGCRATAYHQGLTQDPLTLSPLDGQRATSTETLALYRYARPVPNYTARQVNSGFYLINRNRHIPVSAKARPILETLDGQTTLEEIGARFGQAAIDFVGVLVLSGLVELT